LTVTGPSGVGFSASRRRHARFSRDWSSDVCSSDLVPSARPFGTWRGRIVGRGGADEPTGRAEGTGRPMGGGGAGRLAAGGRRGRGGRLGASRARFSRCRAPARRSSGRRRLARTGAGGLGGTPLARGAAGADPDRP